MGRPDGGEPHRAIEFEFQSLVDAAAYFSRPEIAAVFEDVASHGLTGDTRVLRLRSDNAGGS